MRLAPPRRGEAARELVGEGPLRTCIGCRRVRPQGVLLRIARSGGGSAEPDPHRRGGGRGVYLCRSEACLAEALRRGRWTQVFRAPTALGPEAVERLRAALEPKPAVVVCGATGRSRRPPARI